MLLAQTPLAAMTPRMTSLHFKHPVENRQDPSPSGALHTWLALPTRTMSTSCPIAAVRERNFYRSGTVFDRDLVGTGPFVHQD